MKLKQSFGALSVAALMALASAPASAAYVILDGIQVVTPTTTTTNIGRINLVSGSSTVYQQVNGAGNVFVGSKFVEDGAIFSLSFTGENTVGAGDSGAPGVFGEQLKLTFTNVTGTVTALNSGGGFHYTFDTGNFVLSGAGGNYASGSIVGLGGNLAATTIVGGINGDSTVLSTISSILNAAFDLRTSAGVSLKPQLANGTVLFEAVTNNNVTNVINNNVACPFNTGLRCTQLNVASAGDAYLVQQVPEPGSLALAGLALFGIGAVRRQTRRWKQ